MKLRDLRWYILASFILIISYAAIALCYYLPVRSKAESSMMSLGYEATLNLSNNTTERVNELYDAYQDNPSVVELVTLTAAESKFRKIEDGKRKIILARDKDFMNNTTSDTSYYFYFLRGNEEEGYQVGKISVEDILSFVTSDNDDAAMFTLFIYASDGTIYYTNLEGTNYLMQNVLGLPNFDLVNENDSFNKIYSVKGNRGVLSGTRLFDVYISTFIPITSPYLAIEWVIQQAMIFYSIGIIIAITQLVILVLGCRKASQLLRVDRHSLEATHSIVIRVDLQGKVIFTNKTFKQIYGVRHLETLEDFIDVDTNETVINSLKKNNSFECSVPMENGENRYFHLSPLRVSKSYYLMGTDITDDYNRRKYLYLMNGRNEITNIDNNFSFMNDYKHIVSSAGTYDIAFVEYNIHKYEDIIGVFGRSNFNILLNEFVNILHDNYEGLSLYHINDAKFVVVFPNVDLKEVTDKINESLDVLRRPIQIKQNHIYLKCKIVVYNLKNGNTDVTVDEIKSKLELAYRNIADFSTKDYIVYEPAMDNVIEAAEEMEKDLVKGLQDNEFRMYLQPQYDVFANRIDGFEALIRWTNPKYINDSPQKFIELAEQRGYMLDIGRYVIKETFRLAKQLEPYNVHVSMNVSPIQLLQVGFVQQLIDEFKVLKLKPGAIAIEITETFLMGNFQLMTEKLKRLKEMGFHIHLDDFCTGYSSMLYLKDLPVDTLKIDKEFTKYIVTNKVHSSIVKTICELGNSLGLDIICEGVETAEQRDLVKKFGARLIQGYLIGKALPYEESLELLEQYNKKGKVI